MAKLYEGERLYTYIETYVKDKIIQDLHGYRLFSERDLHANVYYHLRRALGDKKDWIVRCEPSMSKYRPDIVVFNLYSPKIVLELAFLRGDGTPVYPHQKLNEDRKVLRAMRNRYDTIGKGFLITVFDADKEYIYTEKKDEDWEKHYYREIFMNVREFRGYEEWKGNWLIIRSNQYR